MPERICFSISEAAIALSIGERTLHRWIRSGEIAVARLGGRVLVPRNSLEAFVAARTDTTGSPVRQAPPHIRAKVRR